LSGFSADNYAFEIAAGTLTINKAALTLTADNKNKTYNGFVFSGYTYAYTGFVNGETVAAITPGTVTYTGTAITANTAGSYVITPAVSGFSATNYNAPILADGTLTINKVALTLTAENKAKTYDGSVFSGYSYIFAGFVNNESVSDITPGTITFTGTAMPATAAGSYVITPSISGFAATNYNTPNLVEGILTINKATLTVTPDTKSKTYDGLVFTGFTSTISGYVNSETSSVITGSPTYSGAATSATAAGTYASITAVVSGMSANNYTIVAGSAGTLTINKATLTVTPDAKAKTYDGLEFTGFTSTISGYVNSETISIITGSPTYSGAATSETAAGTYASITAVVSGMSANNYNIVAGAAGTLTINKATLTVTPDAKAKTYDGLVFTGFTSTISGYVNSETSSVITGSPTYSGAATSATAAGTYASITAVVSGMSANNYTIVAGAAATLTINKATLTVTPDSKSKTYDGVASTGFSSSYTGFVNSENGSVVTGTAGFGGTAIGAVAAGSYTIIATSGTLSAANYVLVFQAGTLTINKALLSVTANNKTKTYDGLTFSAFTSVISGFVGTEDLSAVTGSIGYLGAAVSATGAGNYTILPTSGTLSAANYAFSFSSGVLSIGKATLSVFADNKSKTYNGQVFTGFTYTLSGFVNGEGPSLVNGSLAFGGDARAATNAGDYQIIPTAGTLTAVNYAFNFLPGTLTINKAVLTVTADNRSKTYDGQPSTGFTASYTGFANGENASVISGAPGFSGTAIGVVAAGNYPINPTPGNITAPNYDFAFQAGTLVINKALLTVTADNKTKTYDGQVFTAFSSVINGFVNNEDLSAVSGSAGYLGAATSATATGTYPILPTTGSLSAANYAFAFSQGALTIGKATLTVSADNKIKIYDGQVFSAFTYTLTGFANGDGPNLVTGSSSISGNARFAINAGEYQIVPTVGTLSASNYTFTFAPGILTISKAILFVTAGNFTKTYDGRALNGFTSAITGFVNGENMSVVSGIPGYSGTGATASVAGSHALSPTVGTLVAANYTFALQDGLVTINRAPLMVTADSITKTYDGQVFTSFTTSFNGFVNAENAIVVTGTASFSGSAMTATQVGQYEIAVTLGTLSASNYVLNFNAGTLTINKALLTLAADNKSKTYDGLGFSAFSATVSGFVNGETAAVVLTGNPLFKGPATTATQKGQYLIVPEAGTLYAANYRFATFVTGSLDIMRSGPMVNGAQTANFIVNQMLAIPAFRVSDPDSGLLGILDITVTTTRGKITIGSNTAQSITFANTILSANQMLAKIKYTTATDSFLNATISVTAQDRDAAGAVVGSWTMSLAPSAGVFAKIQDPSKPGKTSLVVQGSVKNESIVVKPVSASNLTSYTVSMTGMATQVFTGITGRILAYASGGDDTINVSAVKISTLLSGGEGNDIILGGSAADTIFGNGGNDLLIGGLGADIINGDYGNDILVDGSVTLKSKTDTLDKVLATWNSLPAPTTSIYNNITARLSVDFDKLNKDTMGGGNGIDWFWSTTTGAMADTIGIFTGEKRRTI
ncbi:MAG: MBG domain-containing protein, partial [Planctomycetota bacterium]|nr:MBG domain-containing protein [Planctomycetota bacterium]